MAQNNATTAELDDDTERYMHDWMADIGGISDKGLTECVRQLVTGMREHDRDYPDDTKVLVEAAYDAARQAVEVKKEKNAGPLADHIDQEYPPNHE